MIEISVILPTYKPQDYLWECLDSLVAQTFPHGKFEVILVLNGCTEPWKGLIEKYISQNMHGMNVNFIHTEEGGVSNARNIALDVALGEYVTFIDDDDYVSHRFLEELYKKATKDTIALCYPHAFKDGIADKQLSNYSPTIEYERVASYGKMLYPKTKKFFSGPCMKLIPMSFIQDRRYNPRFKNGEDSLFMFLISDKFKYVEFTGRHARYYRRYRKNSAFTIQRSFKNKLLNMFALIFEYCKIYFRHPSRYSFMFFATRIIGSVHSVFNYRSD